VSDAELVARWTTPGEPGLMARIVRLQILASAQLEDVASAHGVTFADYLVLAVIRRSPGGQCAPSTVCDVLHRTSGGMTLTLDRLQRAHWLERGPDPHDRRKVVLSLTPSGRGLAERVNLALHEWEDALARGARKRAMTDSIDELLDLLDREARDRSPAAAGG
jgi:DNA-binding MarR family transcriptional regulator